VRVDDVRGHDLAGRVDDGDLNARTEPGVQAQRRARAGRGGEQQVAEVGREHVDRLVLGGGAQPQPQRVTGLPALGGGSNAQAFYTDGTLFHGESLRGLRRVLQDGESRLVIECALPEHRPAGGAFASSRYAPGTADLLLQAGLVWMRRHRDTASLPMSVARADLYEALPDGEPFVVVVEPVSANGTTATVDVSACAPDGRVLLRFTGLSLVSTPQLAAKFASR
jgi:hypothetical protein